MHKLTWSSWVKMANSFALPVSPVCPYLSVFYWAVVLFTHSVETVASRPAFVIPFVIICSTGQVLQKLGKADETKDAAFEEGVINFNKQYVSTLPAFGCRSSR